MDLLKYICLNDIAWGITLMNLGLCLDILGAFGIIKSFFFKTAQDILKESSTYVGHNPAFYYSLIVQKVDAIIGGLLLSLGFSFQILGNVIYTPERITVNWFLIFFIVLLFLFLCWFLFKHLSRRLSNYIFVIIEFKKDIEEEIEGIIHSHQKVGVLYRVLNKYCNAGLRPDQSLTDYRESLKTWLEDPRKSTLGWWPLSSRPVAWFIKLFFRVHIEEEKT